MISTGSGKEPINSCWSIKGYAVKYPVIDKDWQQTCNVINIKVHLDSEDDNVITGEKRWENDSERVPPRSGGRELPLPPRREKRAGLSALY